MSRTPTLPPALRRSLEQTFGLHRLRSGQAAVIARVLEGRDTLAVMPTGAGKSLCYQLPSLHLNGRTVVVSPLIALMKDQADKLEEAGVAAEALHSAQPAREQQAALERLAEDEQGIVFTTPERLADAEFLATLQSAKVALLVVDEAHCISQWGHDFRPAFLQIGDAVRALGSPPVLALTATATPQVVDDIRKQLRRPRMQVVNTGVYRPNLVMQVVQVTSEDEKDRRLEEALAKAQGSGIVYTATVKAAERVHARLQALGDSVALYHGKLRAADRHAAQDRFMGGEVRVMVATNAFGMGIDKPDIRFVVHYQMPGKLEAYLQEAGRAGRDREAAEALLLFHRKDRQVQQFFLAHGHAGEDDLAAVHAALREAAEPLTVAALRQALPGFSAGRLHAALARLRQAGEARADRQRRWTAAGGDAPAPEALQAWVGEQREQDEHDREALERMVFYAQTGWCRWRVLLDWFGESPPFEQHCGHCDNCLRAPVVPAAAQAESTAPAAVDPAPPRFAAGAEVRVPRYGEGRVKAMAGDEVTVVFADASERRFMADYLQPLAAKA